MPQAEDASINGRKIPRVIYQTYPTKNLPPVIAENVAHIKAINPSYRFELFDDEAIERFIIEEYGSATLRTYRRINPAYGAARADLFRYLLIYKRGGVYLDIKSRMFRPLDSVIKDEDRMILAQWADPRLAPHHELVSVPGSEFQNWHVIATQNHPFLRAVIERVLRNIDDYRPWRHGVGKNAVLRVTGPIAYTLAIYPILNEYPYRLIKGEENLALEYCIADNHARLFQTHYSERQDSLIQLSGLNAAIAKVYFALRLQSVLRRIRRMLINLLRQI